MLNTKPQPGPGTEAAETLAARLQRTELLLQLTRELAEVADLDGALELLVERVSKEIGVERATVFLNDSDTGELYSRVAHGGIKREIRMLNDSGIAGHVYTTQTGIFTNTPYEDARFNRSIDEQTGFTTGNILCAPIKTYKGEIIGVAQVLNKGGDGFVEEDLELLEAMIAQASIALQGMQYVERMQKAREQELEFLDIVADITSEIDLGILLQKVMGEATRMLRAERSTLFLNDEKTNELWSIVGGGLNATQIRLPNHAGIAGTVFTSGQSVNIPHAYADLRFNPAFDRKTGYFTRSILCVPVINKHGKTIGVTQVLNRHGGPFTDEDESRLRAFTAQVSIALENAKLFDDVQNIKNYNESMLESMSNAVITMDEEGKIVTCNAAGLRIMQVTEQDIIGKNVEEYLRCENTWLLEKVQHCREKEDADVFMDAELEFAGEHLSVNVTVMPLISSEEKTLGSMIMLEDMSTEKRMKSTMSRYMDPSISEQLLSKGEDILGGTSTIATILFSDIRGFTTLTEELGPQGTVSLLNEYFTIMVDCIHREGGMLDKFIGDAIMAAFGMPISRDDDEDRGLRAAISMISDLAEWNIKRVAEGKFPVDMGIGLNTDTVVSGNIGSPKRMDYTLIGDGVNLAARLESACKQYSARILISEFTHASLRGTYRMRDIDRVVVKGKTEPVRIYEVLDYHTEESFPNMMEVLGHFRDGQAQYRDSRWDGAVDSFGKCLKLNPDDRLSQIYIERCQLLKENPPPEDWQGVWVMTSK